MSQFVPATCLSETKAGMSVTQPVERVAVIGSGLMGTGIAACFAINGVEVALHDASATNLERSLDQVAGIADRLARLNVIDRGAEAHVTSLVRPSQTLDEATRLAQFVIETVTEDMRIKQGVFQALDELCDPAVVLASNTSSFTAGELSTHLRFPERVIVANWWNPPHLLPLVEVVAGPCTSATAVEQTVSMLGSIGKRPVVLARESRGFVGNRLQFAMLREALAIVDEGIATPAEVDTIVTNGFGRRLAFAGIFEAFDLAGWDTIARVVDELFPDLDDRRTSGTISSMVRRGHLGAKAGQGFYTWTDAETRALESRLEGGLAPRLTSE